MTLFLAFEQQDLERENRGLLSMVRRQYDVIQALEVEHPGIGHVVRDAEGFVLLDEDEKREGAIEVRLSKAS